jgi:peptidoglycan/xylan/chitin deacetylase (PgdA/CDA1 family)
MDGRVFLMYHELELPGRPMCQTDPGYVRYILAATDFESQVKWLKRAGWQGFCVTGALELPADRGVVITFDDGCETDLLAAAPILTSAGFQATFYVTTGFLGRTGYLSPSQLRELSELGFEVGCHSMTHVYLPDLTTDGLHREMVEAKDQLEQITGHQVQHFSCPGGRYDERVSAMARNAGYRTLATSRAHANSAKTSPFELGRVAIMRETSLDAFERICRNQTLWRLRLIDVTRTGIKKVLGNSAYDKARAKLLQHGE